MTDYYETSFGRRAVAATLRRYSAAHLRVAGTTTNSEQREACLYKSALAEISAERMEQEARKAGVE